MSKTRFIIGDALDVVPSLGPGSVDCIVTSPPYFGQRSYLPDDHPDKAHELGQEPTPAEFLTAMLELTDRLWDVLSDQGTMWVNLGEKLWGSGGAGGDYAEGGMREGQAKYRRIGGTGPVRRKSVCWVPALFGASLAYGRNLLTGDPCQQWVTRPPVTWCKPNPAIGELIDRFRMATELIIFASKSEHYWFDLDAVREPGDYHREGSDSYNQKQRSGQKARKTLHTTNPNGVPPLDWWVIPPSQYKGAHTATFPPELIRRPFLAGCPVKVCRQCGFAPTRLVEGPSRPAEGGMRERDRQGRGRKTQGTFGEKAERGWSDCGHDDYRPGRVLDPFGGSGTTAVVANGNGRDAILIDLDERNADLARERVGMWLEVEHFTPTAEDVA